MTQIGQLRLEEKQEKIFDNEILEFQLVPHNRSDKSFGEVVNVFDKTLLLVS